MKLNRLWPVARHALFVFLIKYEVVFMGLVIGITATATAKIMSLIWSK